MVLRELGTILTCCNNLSVSVVCERTANEIIECAETFSGYARSTKISLWPVPF